jgi:nucleoid DNA-binding protein
MKLKELIQLAKEANPDQLKNIPDARATAILRVVFDQLKQEIQTATDKPVSLAGFGQFKIKRVEKEQDGQKVVRQRIFFLPSKPKNAPVTGADIK